MIAAWGPNAENETAGWKLRRLPGQVRKSSVMRPMPVLGIRRGSKAGIASRTICHHALGIGGFCHAAGSVRPEVCAGITSVPEGVSTSSSAWMTATGPPQTHPSALSEEWTSTVVPGSTPSVHRSAARLCRVRGDGEDCMRSRSFGIVLRLSEYRT